MARRSARSSPLSPDLLALLAGCRATPAVDTPRLILADWLDENADTAGLPGPDDAHNRAALIRTQVELGRPTWDTGRIAQLRAAEARLLSANAARWLGDLPLRLDELRRRPPFGFAGVVPHAAPVFKFDPLAPYAPWRFSRGLLTVNLTIKELTERALGKWFASPLAAWVEEAGVDVAGLNELMGLRASRALRPYLGVRYELGRAPPPTLRLVNPPDEQLNASQLKWLLDCANFAHVRSLSVYAPAVEAGFLPLLAGVDLRGVRWLTVRAPLTDTSAAFLAAAPFVNLSALDVTGCDIGPDGMRLLAGSPHLHGLISLRAFRNRFGCDGLVALTASPLAGRLNVLEIQNTGIGDRGVQALAESPLLERLIGPELNLSMNPIGDAGARALVASPQLEPFTELVLRECQVSDAGAAALAASPHVANLEYLDLWKNGVGDAGAAALAASPHLSGVRELSIRDNLITATGANALRARFGDRVKV
ncbi:TIGR02996 domain-containing protein [Frigoriglobus tundricola]|uniref:TIGR02996 domain-containing protein n=1 Tax=Frigoriglobus tundricola TaxID=2774151 RepID=A0A6M5YKG8_9BACT|nr:TIGR02996 domain-containing protein [Frigoriglobus tundricola]QJW93840.1 hypothetical protein FTUN_1352 [Frigoriglobus tundricola]